MSNTNEINVDIAGLIDVIGDIRALKNGAKLVSAYNELAACALSQSQGFTAVRTKYYVGN
jgi:hypothetical protein